MGRARSFIPALKFGHKIYPEDLAIGNPWANYWYVDGDNGSDAAGNGGSVDKPLDSLEQAVSNAARGDIIYVRTLAMGTGATDPESYTENGVITADKDCLSIIGVGTGRTQGGLPQLKVGTTTTQAIITVRAPGCYIANLGLNGSGATGGGILLDDDGSTKTAFGTTIENCHFKNCVGTTATNAATGGGIQWASAGNAWQVLIRGNRFYKNVGDVTVMGTSGSVPQDVVIEDNIFSGPAASVDCNIYVGGGGVNGLIVDNNIFTCNPNIGSGTNASFIVLTSCVGILSNNMFAAQTAEGVTTEIKFGAAQENLVPTTMFMANNYGEMPTGVGAGLISGEIFRT